MSEESVMISSVRDITESTEAEGPDDTHHEQHGIKYSKYAGTGSFF